jgi:hypothetical protein
MKDAIIGKKNIQFLEINWEEDLTCNQLASRFNIWLKDETFIERRLPDLKEAAYCQLSIDPS